jgi:hypothetical protein
MEKPGKPSNCCTKQSQLFESKGTVQSKQGG